MLTTGFAPPEPSRWLARAWRSSLTCVMGWFLVGALGVVALFVWLAWLTGGLSYLLKVFASWTRQIARTGNSPSVEQEPETP